MMGLLALLLPKRQQESLPRKRIDLQAPLLQRDVSSAVETESHREIVTDPSRDREGGPALGIGLLVEAGTPSLGFAD